MNSGLWCGGWEIYHWATGVVMLDPNETLKAVFQEWKVFARIIQQKFFSDRGINNIKNGKTKRENKNSTRGENKAREQ